MRDDSARLHRRQFLRALGGGAAAATASPFLLARSATKLDQLDDQFLEKIERATFQYFWDCADARTGLVKDRNSVRGEDSRVIASIAATGFGLSALCIAESRHWLPATRLRERVRLTLRFLATRMPHEHGFFFHFVHWQTGERQWKCEVSTIDTALLLAGVLTCRVHFGGDREIKRLATEIYDRVDWLWMLNGTKTICHGWIPENGFLKNYWTKYCELMLLYLLAIGANKHAIPPECWDGWQRPSVEYKGLRFISDGAPLFVHQYAHAWFDFRAQRDAYTDYFDNSVVATRAHRQFCIDLHAEFPTYSEELWGITASDSAKGYVVWGGPPRHGPIDGTVVPCAAAGSLPFLPQQTIQCLRTIRERHSNQAWTKYGFIDAFNPRTGWTGPDVIGIDAGISLLMAENLRTGFVWRTFMKNPEARRAMKLAKFRSV